jgi:pyrroloquinoline quinone biosynthesis protein B
MTLMNFLLSLALSFGSPQEPATPHIIILGVAQDAGYPQIGCTKECCAPAWKDSRLRRSVVSFALIDPVEKKWWLFEATPDIKNQVANFHALTNSEYSILPQGIILTHAHIGHYTGLMQFGREALNSMDLPVYTLPRMTQFLSGNGPWSQLVSLKNIQLRTLSGPIRLSAQIELEAFTVPHRDEYSETAGFRIKTNQRRYLFIPDIDKWAKWQKDIRKEVEDADFALIDGTFFSDSELPGRDIREVPHPLVSETTELFKNSDESTRKKIFFIHFNHTNPLLWDPAHQKKIKDQGFNFAIEGSAL